MGEGNAVSTKALTVVPDKNDETQVKEDGVKTGNKKGDLQQQMIPADAEL